MSGGLTPCLATWLPGGLRSSFFLGGGGNWVNTSVEDHDLHNKK